MSTSVTEVFSELMTLCRACLGMCRHCLEATSPTGACHDTLPDVILSLEVATIMLETNSELALDRLQHCAQTCITHASRWEEYTHPLVRQCTMYCRHLYDYWNEQLLLLYPPLQQG
ncbi:hypothetical protein [Lewinella sp. JB7]|uniref:hypothetical protein n=1 Tax=Lewinella sp. JB7 TaxID=2962887 RepID=UPI0020C9BFCB|nr:hypothetical protein [Lewinella sp. JB7]MCP9236985.1 hypothetical protein [Lewinella sp. JB7]